MADTEAKWYILHTYSGYENKVANDIMKVVENRNLQNVIEEVYLPVEMTKQTKENGKGESRRSKSGISRSGEADTGRPTAGNT